MNHSIPVYITLLFFIIVALLTGSVFFALNYGFTKLGYTPRKKNRNLIVTAVIFSGWLFISALIAFNGTLMDFSSTPPKILLILIPSVLGIIYISNSKRVTAMLEFIPKSWLVYIQSFRILMEVMLWMLFTANIIPVQMTFEGMNYDILAGLSAPLIGYYALTVKKWPAIVALLWNFAGFLLVLNITIISVLSTPGVLRQFTTGPSNTIAAYFPFVWIPAFIVPFAFLMHVLSIKQLFKYRD